MSKSKKFFIGKKVYDFDPNEQIFFLRDSIKTQKPLANCRTCGDETKEKKVGIDKNTNIKEKPFNFEFAKNFDKFVKIVNSFRATESIRNDKVVKQYWEKLTLAEKQTIYIFFDNLTKVSDSEKDPNFKMPRTPSQLGVKISPAGQQNQTQNASQPGKEKSQKITSPAKPVADVTPKKAQNPVSVQPITVGESANRYISIDKLLQEVK